uniref:Trans-enoyl reductase TOXD n=1 Tax=Cochliobolus carbonum TaxID=5017 RepID=TOXD_COCCA|nr:RecName: Full=Trans-enoyl reductase TOXD; AltName: Full=TOX2 HC-toxin biosynthesis cluster protein TOXD [Bipolaris zeicola]CAA63129.1 toxD [Bipolaris zeicola]
MTFQKAIVTEAPHRARLVSDRLIPKLRDDYILVRTVSVALNPTDWKHILRLSPPGCLVGCDYAGIVEEVGRSVKKPFKKGDRVCGFAHGGNAVFSDDGTFAEVITVKGDIQAWIPENLSFQEAATLGVGIKTVGQGLYQSLKLSWPTTPIEHAVPILIYGGSTATGTLAIQLAKLSGYRVITTCSPHHFELMKSLGADLVFDYHEITSADHIRRCTQNKLKLVFDTISIDVSARFCDRAMSTEGGEYSALLDVSIARTNISSRWTLAYTVLGEGFTSEQIVFQPYPTTMSSGRNFGM